MTPNLIDASVREMLDEMADEMRVYYSQCRQCFYRFCDKEKPPCHKPYAQIKGQGPCKDWKPLSKWQQFEDKYGITKWRYRRRMTKINRKFIREYKKQMKHR